MSSAFEDALLQAVSLLRELPRRREAVADARGRFARFRQAHPDVRADLLIDQPPASHRVDYDVLLGLPDESTLALSWRPDDGVPWIVEYADHWAAGYVVSVNGEPTSIQSALLFLKLAASRHSELMEELVNQQLIAEAIGEDLPAVSEQELQAALDEFRAENGLSSAAQTYRWLQEIGYSGPRFEALLKRRVQHRKLIDRVSDAGIEPYFHAHREEFDTVQLFRVNTRTEAMAQQLADAAGKHGLLAATQAQLVGDGGLEGSVTSRYAREMTPVLANASPGAVVGPVAEAPWHWVAEVLGRQPARLDAQTRAAIRDQLFQEWLAERREKAVVRWHWM